MKNAKTVRLGDVCEVRAGDSAPQGEELYIGGTVPFVRTSDVGVIHFGALHQTRDRLTEAAARKLRRFKPGSILFPKSGASTFLNHRVLLKIEACVASHLAVITPKDMLNERYLLYALTQVDARVLMQDSAYPALRASDIEAISLPLPPLPEQKAIVAQLDEALARATRLAEHFTTIAKNADLSFKATLAETFENVSGKEVRLGDVCAIDGNLVQDYVKYADYPHIGIDSIEKGTGTLKGYRTVAQDKVMSGKYHFTSRHIIYSKIRPNLNKVAIPDFEGLCSADSYAILPKPNCDRKWLAYLMRSPRFLAYVVPISNTRTGMPKVNRNELLAFEFPIPPLSGQRDIVARLDAARARCEGIAEQAWRGAAAAENLKKALLKEAFE